MEFNPAQPDETVNVSDVHPLMDALVLILGAGAILALVGAMLVFLVDGVLLVVPPDAEARLFADMRPDGTETAARDRPTAASLQAIVDRLAAHWPEAPYDFRVGVLAEPQPNALALPGGSILVTRGLLEQVESENELAFVMGHELGHFRHRDHLRQMGRGVAFSLLLATAGAGIDTQLGTWVSHSAGISFSRGQESKADAFGLSLVEEEYGHVAGSTDFFDRMIDLGLDGRGVPFLSSHPTSEDRTRRTRAFAERNGWATEGSLAPWSPEPAPPVRR